MIYRCTDLVTTGVDIDTALVLQAAIVDAVDDAALRDRTKRTQHTSLFAARDVPVGATKVHRITDRNPERFDFPVTVIPRDAPDFAACVLSMVRTLTEPGVVSVSFNGCGYDLPILARYVHALGPSVARAIVDYAADRATARRHAKAARRVAETRLSIDRMVSDYASMYRLALTEAGVAVPRDGIAAPAAAGISPPS